MTLRKATYYGLPAIEDSDTPGTIVTAMAGDGGDIVAEIAKYVVSLDCLDIRRFGAVDDADDVTTEIQDCIDTATAVGKRILIPAGTWNCSQLEIPSNCHLYIAAGATVTQIADTDSDFIVNSDQSGGNTDIWITGYGTINGDGSNQAAYSDAINFTKVDRLKIDGQLRITDAQSMGLLLHTCTDFSISGLRQTDSEVGDGCKVYNSSYGIIRDCWFDANVGDGGYGITISQTDGGNDHIDIVNCRMIGNSDEAFVCFGCEDIKVISCWLGTTATASGFHIENVNRCHLIDCLLEGNNNYGGTATDSSGSCTDLLFRGCVIRNNGSHGLYIQTTGFSMDNCIVAENTGHGIYLLRDYPSVRDCQIHDNGLAGIQCYRSTGINLGQIAGNRVWNNGQDTAYSGIRLNKATGFVVQDNICYDTDGTGTQTYGIEEVEAGGGGTNYIKNNLCYENKTGGIDFDSEASSTDDGNHVVAR